MDVKSFTLDDELEGRGGEDTRQTECCTVSLSITNRKGKRIMEGALTFRPN